MCPYFTNHRAPGCGGQEENKDRPSLGVRAEMKRTLEFSASGWLAVSQDISIIPENPAHGIWSCQAGWPFSSGASSSGRLLNLCQFLLLASKDNQAYVLRWNKMTNIRHRKGTCKRHGPSPAPCHLGPSPWNTMKAGWLSVDQIG